MTPVLLLLLCCQALSRGLSEELLPPPQNIHVDKWNLTWTPATKEPNVTYTVFRRFFNRDNWEVVPTCVHISLNSCNITLTKAEAEHGCVMLRVRAERRGLTSMPVEACSSHGDLCTPEFSLTARPGSLTVHLSRNHNLAQEYAGHAEHRIYFGKEGEPLEEFRDTLSSVIINKLEGGQRYCTSVEFLIHKKPAGLSHCVQCEFVPVAGGSKQAGMITAGVLVSIIVVIPVIAYVLIFHLRGIKKWLRPPCEIPDAFLKPFPEQHAPMLVSSPTDEHWDMISSFTPKENGGSRPASSPPPPPLLI